jgi:hypothetical protein
MSGRIRDASFLRQKIAEADAKAAVESGAIASPPTGAPPPPPLPAVAPPRAVPSAETTDDAREARRRGVAAAIARGEEPAGRFEGIASALPAATQAAAGLPVRRLRILKNDVPASLPRQTPMARFMARVREVAATLVGQGVSARCLETTAESLVVMEKGRGFTWLGLNAIATVTKYCTRQIQRATRLLEGSGLFDIMNVPYREGDEWWRDANIYVATMDEEPAPLPADVEAPDPVVPASASRALGGGSRLAALFGLVLRAGGLNTSPASNYRTRPAPS